MEEHDRTYIGLHAWSKAMFQKIGWMLIAHNENNIEQLKCFSTTTNNLLNHINIKIEYLKKLNKKQVHPEIILQLHDMEILKHNVAILLKHSMHLVKTCKQSKKNKMNGGA